MNGVLAAASTELQELEDRLERDAEVIRQEVGPRPENFIARHSLPEKHRADEKYSGPPIMEGPVWRSFQLCNELILAAVNSDSAVGRVQGRLSRRERKTTRAGEVSIQQQLQDPTQVRVHHSDIYISHRRSFHRG